MKIFLIGFMGCGKSHWGQLLSQKLKLPFFDLDEKIVEQEGKQITEIFAELGEEYFRMLEKEALHMIVESHESFVMASGGGTPCFFNNIDFMKKRGTVVWINCTTDTLYDRLLKEKQQRPLIKNIPDEDLRGQIIRKLADRRIFYQQADIICNEEDITIEKLVDRVFHA